MDAENVKTSLDKCKFGGKEVEWLGFVLNKYGTTLMQKKADAIKNLQHPKTFKQLKSFMGSIHRLNKFITNLAQKFTPSRPVLFTTNKFNFVKNITGQRT